MTESLIRFIVLLYSQIKDEREFHVSVNSLTYYETHLGVTFSIHGTVSGDRLKVVSYIS
jgi:hypothetical protein